MHMSEINYTIIIPHYNLPDLLERCLKSIPYRDDIQTIVVDDCSNDENKVKLFALSKRYPNVEIVFQKENRGGGAARNAGLAAATGKFVLFADADDYFCEGFEALLDKYSAFDKDITFFNAKFVDTISGEPAKQKNHVEEIIQIFHRNAPKGEKLLRFYFGEPWCKMIRRQVIQDNNLHFDETKIHNDTKFSYTVGYYSKTFAVCDEPIYNYTFREGSVSKIISDDRLLARVKVFSEKNRFLQEHNVDFFDKLIIWPFKYCKEHHKEDVYQQCLEIAAQNGFNKDYISKLLRQERIATFLPRLIKKLKKEIRRII